MIWPFNKIEERIERRAAGAYSQAIIDMIQTAAGVTSKANPTATSAAETAAGIVGRAFATVEVHGADRYVAALSPPVMAHIGRSLVLQGESVWLIRVFKGAIQLTPAYSCTITGKPARSSWRYELTLGGPSETQTTTVGWESVLHFQSAHDPDKPWVGKGPLQGAKEAVRASAESTTALADELSGARGYVLPTPSDPQTSALNKLRTELENLSGQTTFVETQTGDWSSGAGASGEWMPRRIGASPPASLVELYRETDIQVLSACGVPIELAKSGQGTASREAYRRFLFGTINALGMLVEHEIRLKLDDAVKLTWKELQSSDITGRARAFQSMVGAGMKVDQALALSGLLQPEGS